MSKKILMAASGLAAMDQSAGIMFAGGRGTYKKDVPNQRRNDPCACGSGKKYKKCCILTPH